MTDEPAARLSGDEVVALRFAAHRQLSRWARPGLSTHQHQQRAALRRAVRMLQTKAFARACELRALSKNGNVDD
jgi:hypothetical protein